MSYIERLQERHPVARKEHTCMYCGCKIKIGERYERCTNKYMGQIYDWVIHEDCSSLAQDLDMYARCDGDGLGDDDFIEFLYDYLRERYYSDENDDEIREDVLNLSTIEQVRKIIADWDTPESKIVEYRRYLRGAYEGHWRDTEKQKAYIEDLKKKIEELENGLRESI